MWLFGPWVDLGVFAFSWIPPWLACLVGAYLSREPLCDVENFWGCGSFQLAMFVASNQILFLHRHYTLGLTYGDPIEFAKRRGTYLWLPLILFALMAPFALAKLFSPGLSALLHTGLVVLCAPAAAWTVYHTVLQKYGLLRAYSVKLGYGDARLERRMLLAWTFFMAVILAAKYAPSIPEQVALWHNVDVGWLRPLLRLVAFIAVPAGLPALWLTTEWLKQERTHYSRASLPKLIYVGSILLLLLSFLPSILTGYIGAQFNHSLEYIAFVNIYGTRKPGMARWAASPWIGNLLVIAVSFGIYRFLKYDEFLAAGLFAGYAAYNAYLHFVYDGFLWKLREPGVRATILG